MLLAAFGVLALAPFPTCPVRVLLRIPCPGCGATRSVLAALHGDLHGSWHLHPLAIPTAVLLVPTMALVMRNIARGEPGKPLPRALRWVWTVLVTALYALWIARFLGAFGGPAPV